MVVARPVSAFARQYVYDLELADAEEAASHSDKDEEDRPPSSGAEPAASDSESSLRGSSSSSDRTTIRVRWLLLPMPQTVLAAVLCGLTLVWGASWGAWAETVVRPVRRFSDSSNDCTDPLVRNGSRRREALHCLGALAGILQHRVRCAGNHSWILHRGGSRHHLNGHTHRKQEDTDCLRPLSRRRRVVDVDARGGMNPHAPEGPNNPLGITVPTWAPGKDVSDVLVIDGRVTNMPLWTARTRHERNTGLLGTDNLAGALWIRHCNMIHTFGMRYAIDAVYVSRKGLVLSVVHTPPNRLGAPRFRASAVVELTAGVAQRLGLERGSIVSSAPQ